ncbi:hypothetical protein LCGC14_2129150 [marine sediment metagenome]|uniref:Uncharacterized protein n=1 Tax=marine sediment metagenome TaxID=412755 RepID=A0A0F9GEZ8_9ZZZZ
MNKHVEKTITITKTFDVDVNISKTIQWISRLHPFVHTTASCEGASTEKPYVQILVSGHDDLQYLQDDLSNYADIVFKVGAAGCYASFHVVFHSREKLLDLEKSIDLEKVNQQDCWCPLKGLLSDDQ